MKRYLFLLFIFLSVQSFAQISGNISDKETDLPIDYVNIWIKNSLRGTTTDAKGNFEFKNAKIGDTLLISYLGYEELQFSAEKVNIIELKQEKIELDEVVILTMRSEKLRSIKSYKRYKKINEFYYNGHYSLARFYEYKKEYSQNPFIQKLSLVVSNALNTKPKFKVHLIKADKNGKPSKQILSEYYILETDKGKNEITIDLSHEKLEFPKDGFFIVVDRLNLKENKFSNKLASDILQPAIGIENDDSKKNTWLGYSGKWIAPDKLKQFTGSDKNIAINIILTD